MTRQLARRRGTPAATVRRTASVCTLLLAAVALAACGRDEAQLTIPPPPTTAAPGQADQPERGDADDEPDEDSAEVEDASVSGHEAEPTVKLVRRVADAIARAVNAQDTGAAQVAPFATRKGVAAVADAIAEDIGKEYRGPLPFTPTDVAEDGNTAIVRSCAMVLGWAFDPATGQPADAPLVANVDWHLVRTGTRAVWKLDDLTFNEEIDCSTTQVRPLPW